MVDVIAFVNTEGYTRSWPHYYKEQTTETPLLARALLGGLGHCILIAVRALDLHWQSREACWFLIVSIPYGRWVRWKHSLLLIHWLSLDDHDGLLLLDHHLWLGHHHLWLSHHHLRLLLNQFNCDC